MQRSWSEMPASLRGFVLLCVGLELVAIVGQLFFVGDGMRRIMIALGGFWPELLRGAEAVYPGQPVTMFFTSTVLHGGLLHLFMNMVAMLWLGPMVIDRVGERGFWPIAGLSALGSGAVFALLSDSFLPMVGASGILFGLVGVLAVWEVRDRRRSRRSLRPLLEQAGVFIALNLALMLLAGGSIAWQAHLGGCLAGALCGMLFWPGSGRVLRL